MGTALLLESEERIRVDTPYLSYSRVNRYLLCPEQYRLYYLEGLRPMKPSASLTFGQLIHESLASFFQEQTDPVALFANLWEKTRAAEMTYSGRESWEVLLERGRNLLELFVQDEAPKLTGIQAVERAFELQVSNLDLPFMGVIDLVAMPDGIRTVVDFKTSGQSYADYEIELSDQLTAYQLAEPQAARCALCVLVKTKEPKIEWHFSHRRPEQLTAYLAKVGYAGNQIAAGQFYLRPGKHCAWCDYLPICLGDEKAVEETLESVSDTHKT